MDQLNEYDKLKRDFEYAVEKLQNDCPHTKWSEPMDEWWAMGHSTGKRVRLCERCDKKQYVTKEDS